MGVLDRVGYVRGGYTGYNGSGPAPGVAPDIGLSASFGLQAGGQSASSDASVQATGILIIALAAIVFLAGKGFR